MVLAVVPVNSFHRGHLSDGMSKFQIPKRKVAAFEERCIHVFPEHARINDSCQFTLE